MKNFFILLVDKMFLPALTWILNFMLRIIVELLLKTTNPKQAAKFFSKIFYTYTKKEKDLDKKEEQLADLFVAVSQELRNLHETENSSSDDDFLDNVLNRLKDLK